MKTLCLSFFLLLSSFVEAAPRLVGFSWLAPSLRTNEVLGYNIYHKVDAIYTKLNTQTITKLNVKVTADNGWVIVVRAISLGGESIDSNPVTVPAPTGPATELKITP